MKQLFTLIFCAALLVPVLAQARGSMGTISRGGLGFLFPDGSSLANPGQVALDHGVAVQLEAGIVSGTTEDIEDLSVVYGNGNFGLGIEANDVGLNTLTNPTSGIQTVTAAMGFALAKDRLTLGAGYTRQTSGTISNNGTVSASLNWNPMADKGFGIGFGAFDTLAKAGASTYGAMVSAGYAFRKNNSFEVFVKQNAFDGTSNQAGGIALTLGSQFIYFGLLGQYNRLAADYEAAGRLGFVLGNVFDISLFADEVVVTGAALTYGASARFVF